MRDAPAHIGIVEDDATMGESLRRSLELEGWRTTWWRSGQAALSGIAASKPELVICDIRLPDMDGESIYRAIGARAARPPFIFMTAFGQIDQAISLVREGAEDYLVKPFDIGVLFERARRVFASREPDSGDFALGVSDRMRAVEGMLRRLADRSLPVLLTGETGTGKEICARFLHAVSARAAEPFMAVNCAAIPAELLESEVFGHEKGAFSGATQRHLGYAERADGGTLFLDEIAEMPLGMQPKLLRLLEERSFHRVGSRVTVPLRARLVCASNRDLADAVKAGAFREDLFYRINAVQVDLPPLRERREDIPWLLTRLFEAADDADRGRLRGISTEAHEAARLHGWPGNARELRNRLMRALALASGTWLTPADLFPEAHDRKSVQEADHVLPLSAVRDAAERRQIERALAETQGHVGEAAKRLDVSRTTLWEKMRRYGLGEAKAI